MSNIFKDLIIDDIVEDISDGGTPSRSDSNNYGGNIPWVVIKDIKPEIFKTKEYLSKKGLINCSSKLWPTETIILSTGATIGEVGVSKVPLTTKQGIAGIRLNSLIDVKYGYYLFLSLKNEIKRLAQGSTIQEIRPKYLVQIPIKLPENKSIQKKIAKILSTVDKVIEKTESAISKYQAIKQGLMHDLFTRGIDVNTGRLRPTPQEAPELYKESVLGLIPRDWEVEELVSLTKLVTDGAHFSPVPQEKGLPIGNVKDMRDSNFDYDNCTKILPEVFKLLVRQNCSPIKGDVLLSKDGTIGKVIHFEDDIEIVLLSSIAIIRVNELLDSRYLSWALQSEYFDKALYALLSGSALKRITLKDILKIRLPFSKDIEEQIQIAARLEKIKDKIQTEQQALAKYQQLKAGLLQDLLTGEVEVGVD